MPQPLGFGIVGAGAIGIRGALMHLSLPDVASLKDPARNTMTVDWVRGWRLVEE